MKMYLLSYWITNYYSGKRKVWYQLVCAETEIHAKQKLLSENPDADEIENCTIL